MPKTPREIGSSIWEIVRKSTRKLIALILSIPKRILLFLDWMISMSERLVVLAITYIVSYIGWCTFHAANQAQYMKDTLGPLSDNWKGLLVLLIPLFYRPVRSFLERVERFAGMETGSQKKQSPDSNKGE
jgi:hypothetical protein